MPKIQYTEEQREALQKGLIHLIILPFFSILRTSIGMYLGWSVDLVFEDTSSKALNHFGLQNWELWEVGAVIGFLTSFFQFWRISSIKDV